jgi:type II secretory pathway component PulM
MDDSTAEWLTYEQAAERMHVSAAAVRARANPIVKPRLSAFTQALADLD